MWRSNNAIQLSASDLVGHLNCRHLTNLDLAVVDGRLKKPQVWDPLLDVLRERGARHEKEFIEHLVNAGHRLTVVIGPSSDRTAASQTIDAMRFGADIVVQGALRSEGWGGRADILRKISTPSDLGPWSYEVIDTKLAQETKGGTVLQLCLYSELVSVVQGFTPEYTYVVTPWTNFEPEGFRTATTRPTIATLRHA